MTVERANLHQRVGSQIEQARRQCHSVEAAKATRMYPAWAIEEKASMRLTLVCSSAAKFPAHMVSTAEIHIAQEQCAAPAQRPRRKSSASARRRRFGRGREQRGHRRGRAFVNVRRVKSEMGDEPLKAKPYEHHSQPKDGRAAWDQKSKSAWAIR